MTKYDANKSYIWTPDDKFEMNGEQFGLILNAFRAILSTEEAQRVLLVNKANHAVEEVVANAVENNIIKEQEVKNDV